MIARFDGVAVWATITPEQRDAIGAAALEYAAGWYAVEAEAQRELTPIGRAAQESWDVAAEALAASVIDALSRETFLAPDGRALIPSVVGPICRMCGCSEKDACPGGCSWAAEDLCSGCSS